MRRHGVWTLNNYLYLYSSCIYTNAFKSHSLPWCTSNSHCLVFQENKLDSNPAMITILSPSKRTKSPLTSLPSRKLTSKSPRQAFASPQHTTKSPRGSLSLKKLSSLKSPRQKNTLVHSLSDKDRGRESESEDEIQSVQLIEDSATKQELVTDQKRGTDEQDSRQEDMHSIHLVEDSATKGEKDDKGKNTNSSENEDDILLLDDCNIKEASAVSENSRKKSGIHSVHLIEGSENGEVNAKEITDIDSGKEDEAQSVHLVEDSMKRGVGTNEANDNESESKDEVLSVQVVEDSEGEETLDEKETKKRGRKSDDEMGDVDDEGRYSNTMNMTSSIGISSNSEPLSQVRSFLFSFPCGSSYYCVLCPFMEKNNLFHSKAICGIVPFYCYS